MSRGEKGLKCLLVALSITISLIVLIPQVKGERAERWDVGITFTESSDKDGRNDEPRPPKDNTSTASKKKAINKRVRLPQTGESIKQLSFFATGIILVVIGFALVLDQQVKGG